MTENHYPNFVAHDPWAATIDAGRCISTRNGRRCQLWTDHPTRDVLPTVPHAAEWRENEQPHLTHAPTRRPTTRWVRWDDAGNVWEVKPGSERLPWAAMGRP